MPPIRADRRPTGLRPVLLMLLAFVLAALSPAHAEKRVALVIGNGAYQASPLANPVNDATAIATALRALGFTTTLVTNASKAQMAAALSKLSADAQGADIAAVYFAGHGTERAGQNYLIPIDATLPRASDLGLQAIALSDVVDQLAGASKLKLVILDACRNNIFPLADNRRSTPRGLARVEPDDNTLIAYAAKDGTTAADDTGGANSPFAAALLKHLPTPGLEIRFLLAEVRDEVIAATGRQQQPFVYGSLGRERVFLAAAAATAPVAAAPTSPPVANAATTPRPFPVLPTADLRRWRGLTLTPQVGHSASVDSVALSANGRILASGSSDETIKVWDAATGRLLRTLEGHKSTAMSVALSADGSTVVSGSLDKSVKVWNATTGRLLHTLDGHAEWVRSVALSADGRTVVSGSDDKTVKVWDAATGRLLHTLEGHTDAVYSVALSVDGRTIISGGNDKTIKVWGATGGLLRTLNGHTGQVNSVALSVDARTIVSGSFDKTVKVWDAATGRLLRTLEGHKSTAFSVALSADGRTVVSGSHDKTVKVWDAATGRLLRTLAGHTELVQSVALSADGRTIVSGSYDNTVKVWEAASGRLIRALDAHAYSFTAVALSADGRTIVSGSSDSTVKIWEAASGRLIRTLMGHTKGVTAIALSADGHVVTSRDDSDSIIRWELESGRVLPPDVGDKALLDRAKSSVRSVVWAGSTVRRLGTDGTVLARLTALPDNAWVSIAADGRTYTGLPGVEKYLLLVEDGTNATRALDDSFIAAFRRDALEIAK